MANVPRLPPPLPLPPPGWTPEQGAFLGAVMGSVGKMNVDAAAASACLPPRLPAARPPADPLPCCQRTALLLLPLWGCKRVCQRCIMLHGALSCGA